jgi:GNAT superfamily N-acetyltransferase
MSKITVYKTGLVEILQLRDLFLNEVNVQIIYNSFYERGWTDTYLIAYNNSVIGYGALKGNDNRNDRNTIFEFYIMPSYRAFSISAFSALIYSSKAAFIECQSNVPQLANLLHQFSYDINSRWILFEDYLTSNLIVSDALFRKKKPEDMVFEHKIEPVGDYVLELNGNIIATGGFLLHYNFPFADLFMEVKEDFQRKGFGSYIIQEVKQQCYLTGRVPSARCMLENIASRDSLLKAGFRIAGFMLIGNVKQRNPGI